MHLKIEFPEEKVQHEKSQNAKTPSNNNKSPTKIIDTQYNNANVLAHYNIDISRCNDKVIQNKKKMFLWPEIKQKQFMVRKSMFSERIKKCRDHKK